MLERGTWFCANTHSQYIGNHSGNNTALPANPILSGTKIISYVNNSSSITKDGNKTKKFPFNPYTCKINVDKHPLKWRVINTKATGKARITVYNVYNNLLKTKGNKKGLLHSKYVFVKPHRLSTLVGNNFKMHKII